MIVKLLNVPFSNDDLNFYNTFQKTDFEDVIGLSSIGEIDVAANMISTTEMILNIDEVNLQNKFNYVCVIDELFFEKRKTYWFVESIDRSKSKTKPRVRIVLDSISSFGDLVHQELDGKYVFLERAHFDRWKISSFIQVMPNIDGNSIWYFKDEFNDTVDDNSEFVIEDFDDELITDNFIDPRKIGWGILNTPSLKIINSNINKEVVIIGNDTFADTYTTIEGLVTPIFIDENTNHINHISKYSDGTLNALYYSPFLFKKTAVVDTNSFTKVILKGKETFTGVNIGTDTTLNVDVTSDFYDIKLNWSNSFNLSWLIDDVKNDSNKLNFNWKYELKIFNNNNFKTSIGFTGIDEVWDLNLEQIVFNWENIKAIPQEINTNSLNKIDIRFRTKLTSTTGVIDASVYVLDNKFYKNPNYQFQYSLNQIPVFTDQYQQYIRENKSQINVAKHQASENAKWAIAGGALNIFSGTGKIAAGGFVGLGGSPVGGIPSGLAGGAVASSGVSGIAGGLQSIATASFERDKIQAQLDDKRRLNSTSGNPSVNYLNQIVGVGNYSKLSYIIHQKRHYSILEAKARYHLKFGYQINDNLKYSDKLYGRYLFNFIQISDIKIFLNKTNLEKDIINLISQKFELGLRIWNDYDEINNYNLENWETSIYNFIK